MPEPTYRQATPADADAIAAVGAAVWDELGERSGLLGRITADGVRVRLDELATRLKLFVLDPLALLSLPLFLLPLFLLAGSLPGFLRVEVDAQREWRGGQTRDS